jgi:hypothetical protein
VVSKTGGVEDWWCLRLVVGENGGVREWDVEDLLRRKMVVSNTGEIGELVVSENW